MAIDLNHETVICTSGSFKATHGFTHARYYLYLNDERVSQINSGKHPDEVYGSVEKWIEHVKKRSQKRLEKIKDIQLDLAMESSALYGLVSEADSVLKTS